MLDILNKTLHNEVNNILSSANSGYYPQKQFLIYFSDDFTSSININTSYFTISLSNNNLKTNVILNLLLNDISFDLKNIHGTISPTYINSSISYPINVLEPIEIHMSFFELPDFSLYKALLSLFNQLSTNRFKFQIVNKQGNVIYTFSDASLIELDIQLPTSRENSQIVTTHLTILQIYDI